MTPDRLAAKGFYNGRRNTSRGVARSRRLLLIAVGLSVLVHVLPLGLFVLLPRGAPPPPPPGAQGEVELLMVEQKGAEASQAGQPSETPARPAPEQADATPAPEKTPPLPAEADAAGEPVPPPPLPTPPPPTPPSPTPPSPVKEATKQAQPAPEAPPPSPKGLEFNFAGTDSDTNAQVVSGHVLPALPDDRFRNRPPPYPLDAAMRGEAGAVVVIIHVSAYGLATGADVAESSGSASLDRAAVAAVRKWHFRPAMSEGQAVPFDMPFRFVFSTN
jgi:protein TonB